MFAGLNLSLDDFDQITQHRKQSVDEFPCLWLNLCGWTPKQESITQKIAKQYQLSPRLAHFMCPWSNSVTQAPPSSTASTLPSDLKSTQTFSFANTFNAVWHFCTVDFGRHYICLGWNALFFLQRAPNATYQSKPNAVRIWSSVLICDDGLVVSVFEAPPFADPELVSRVRQNQVNVFRSLSHARNNQQSPVLLVHVPGGSAGHNRFSGRIRSS